MNKQSGGSGMAVGASSLLVIFAVLCLAVFALLTMSTVRAEMRLSENTRNAVTAYYEAQGEAQQILARLRAGEVPEGVGQENGVYCYACPISDTGALLVEVRLDGTSYEILRWQAVSTTEWTVDESIPVWQG